MMAVTQDIDAIDDLEEMAADLPFQTRAEEGIDQGMHRMHPVQSQDRVNQGRCFLGVVNDQVWQAEPFEDGIVERGISPKLFRVEQGEDKGEGPEAVM